LPPNAEAFKPARMFAALANPHRFMAFSRWAAPILGVIAAILIVAGLWFGFNAPQDYQQGTTVRIMFIHVPAASVSLFIYACLGGASFFSLVFRHALADAAARAAAPLGAAYTLLALVTGSLWGRSMWGTWWVWDARLTPVLIQFLLFLGYIALRASIDDEARAARAAAILALVGLLNLFILKLAEQPQFDINTLHQGESIFVAGGPKIAPVFLLPLALMAFGYIFAFGSLWLARIRGEVWRRRAEVLAVQAAGA
jgi:heme exporter protein C